jgi:hypothetical protein
MNIKRLLLIPLLVVVGVSAGGCWQTFGEVTKAITTTIDNPVGGKNIYQAKLVYASALEIAVKYREYCYSRPYAELMADPVAKPICQNRRPNVRALQSARWKASAAIRTADAFVRNNPTLNATSAIGAAWTAVTDFQNLAARATIR